MQSLNKQFTGALSDVTSSDLFVIMHGPWKVLMIQIQT
jgi:hypothetical protein